MDRHCGETIHFAVSLVPLAIIRFAVMMHLRNPLSLCQVEGLLVERGNDLCHEMCVFVERVWSDAHSRESGATRANSVIFAVAQAPALVLVNINDETRHLWGAVDN